MTISALSALTAVASLAQRELSTQELRILVLITMLHTFVLMVLVSLPLARGTIKPNKLYGLRTKATLGDDRVWYEANAYAGRLMIRGGIGGIIVALGLFFVPGLGELYVGILLTVLLVGVLVLSWVAARYARRLARGFRAADEMND